jgi:hypothetical protein
LSLKQLRDELRSLLKEELKELSILSSLQSPSATADNSKVVSPPPEKSVSSNAFLAQFCSLPKYKILSMAKFGLLGRQYMSESIRLAKCDFKKPLFDAKVIWN